MTTDRNHDLQPGEAEMLAAARYVDAQLDPVARVAFEARLASEPSLAHAVRLTEALRAPFVAARDDAPRPLRPDFAARVLAAARRLPTPDERGVGVGNDPAASGILVLARRLLVAAALIFGLGLLIFAGLLRRADSGRLEAAPVQQKKLDELDAKIRAAMRTPEGSGERPR